MVLITLISVIILYNTIKSNKKLNENNFFNELVKQERELRVKLSEYRENIHKKIGTSKKDKSWTEITFDYDTLLFNYYEYVALCISQGLVNENLTKKYFKQLLISVKDTFDASILFEEHLAEKEDYPGINWLFKRWSI